MATAKSVDEYIDNLTRKYTYIALASVATASLITIFIGYLLLKNGSPPVVYSIVVIPVGVFIWVFHRRAKETGDRIWNILCPECDEYIPLHQFECPRPCPEEYTNRSIIEGCPSCKTRYKKEGHDAFRHAVCDDCGYELEFSEPYDFKPWSVLSKGQTWENETLVVKNDTAFSHTWYLFIIVGLVVSVLLLLMGVSMRAALAVGLYLYILGVFFLLIHKILYGDMKRIPNPTFKRPEEPEEIYVPDNPLKWNIVLSVGAGGVILSGILVYVILINLLLPLLGYQGDDLTAYTPFDISWRVILFVAAIVVIVIHSRFYKEYKKVPNPRYKEDEP